MTAQPRKKLVRILLPLLVISIMTGSILYQGLLTDTSTLLSTNDAAVGPQNPFQPTNLFPDDLESSQDMTLSQASDSPWDSVGGDPSLPETLDIGKFLGDNLADYQKVWEPWLTKAGIHDIESSADGEFLAVGGGFLYDNELHVYRWNSILNKYVRAWESGDGLFQGDIRSVAFGDTDQNLFLEVAGASSDGFVYLFEQTHIFDPNTRTETRFDHVWTSPYIGSAWGVEISDMDLDQIIEVVVGSWDGYVHWFEYNNHSGYPYSQDHWIDLQEIYRQPIDGHIQSITTGDFNGNGLQDIVVGTKEGSLSIIENDGTILGEDIGTPFALPQDNRYRVIWENDASIWSPIMKLDSGQLDADIAEEAVVVARGQGVYTLDYDFSLDDFVLTKMVRPIESWEAGGAYPLDNYIDWMLYPSTGNVTYTNYTAPYYTWNEPHSYGKFIAGEANHIFPYNSSIAQAPDGNMTKFDASISLGSIASAILDFGQDEEATGDARMADPVSGLGYDLEIYSDAPPPLSQINLSISMDLEEWEQIPTESLRVSGNTLFVDIDHALSARQWLFARYINVTVHSDGVFYIDAIKTKLVNKQLESATAAVIGQANLEWNNPDEENKIIIGTVEGRMLVYRYDNSAGNTTLLFDSYTDERYTLSNNIWDIVQIPKEYNSTFPTWIAEANNDIIDLPSITMDKISSISAVPITSSGAHNIVINRNNVLPKPIQLYQDDGTNLTDTTNFFLWPNFWANWFIDTLKAYTQSSSAFSQAKTDSRPKYLAVSLYDALNPYDPNNPSSEAHAFIFIWYFNSGAQQYYFSHSLSDNEVWGQSHNEITGQLNTVLKMSQIQPTMAWGDMDNDGNEDLVVANGKLYLIRNLGGSSWELVPDYFEEINQGIKEYRNPQLVDFDLDGDLDLIMSEEGYSMPGLFYWVNIGSGTSPSWEYRRQDLYNLRYEQQGSTTKSTFLGFQGPGSQTANYSLFTIEYGESINETISMLAFNNLTTNVDYFRADYESQNSLIVGINPYLARVDMNLRPPSLFGTEDKNYGYRILSTWNTQYELDQWTQAITALDLDGDGKRELVVGDFDNNIYVFEHLANNSYKRAYRSFDLSRQFNTSESPYAAQQLSGLSASFIRFEWQHVELITGGMDIDGDGFQEFAAIAGLTIYLFEHTGRDDSYQLIWSINLGETAWSTLLDYFKIASFTALSPSDDMNYNGKDELLAAVGPFLFIFEGEANNEISEIFMNPSLENMFSVGSKYVLPENGLLHYFATYDGSFDLEITQVYVGDVIKNTPEKEIVVVGVNRTSWGHEHGFGMIMRHRGVSFIHVAEFPREVTWLNPISDIKVDDQDYDGQPEIILGHAHGVDSWEVHLNLSAGSLGDPSEEFSLNRQAILSGSLNYPNSQSARAIFEPFNKMPAPRETEVIALRQAVGNPLGDNYLPQGSLVQTYSGSNNAATGRLQWASSTDNGTTWQYGGFMFSHLPMMRANINETEPALYQDRSGRLWVAFTAIGNSGGNFQAIYLAEYNPALAEPWQYVETIDFHSLPGDIVGSPSIFAYPKDPENGSWIGISFLNMTSNKAAIIDYYIPTHVMSSTWIADEDGKLNGTAYTIHSSDAIFQDHGPGNGSLIFAFAGRETAELRLDTDIWAFLVNWNAEKSVYNWSLPIRATRGSSTEAYPDLAQLQSADGTVLLTFERQGSLMACHSKTGGSSWSEAEQLLTLPEFIVYRHFPALGIALATWSQNSNVIFSEIEIRSPSMAALPFGGFTYAYTMSYNAYLLEKLPLDTDSISEGAAEYAIGAAYQYQLVPINPSTLASYYNNLGNQAGSYTTTVGYYLLQTVAQSLFSSASNVANSFPPTTSGFLTTYISSSGENLYNARIDGAYSNIFTRTNLAQYWMEFDFLEANGIDVGDTDGDARREIAIYSGNRAYIAEITHSQPSSLNYRQIWASGDLGTLTDLAIYDGNGNGFEEVYVSAGGGDVYSFEIDNLELPRTMLQFANSQLLTNRSWMLQTDRRYNPVLASFDADDDELDELILADWGTGYSNLTIFPGSSFGNESTAISKQLNGSLTTLKYRDVNFDDHDDLAYGTDQGEYGIIDVHLSLLFGSLVLAYENQTMNEPVQTIDFAFRTSDNSWAFLVVGSSKAILASAYGGILWNTTDFNGTTLIGGAIGDLGVSLTESTDAVIVDELGNIHLLDLGNGSVLEIITEYAQFSSQEIQFTVAELNADGKADLLLAINNRFLVAMDGASRSTSFNYTGFQTGEIFRQIVANDFDSDGLVDILLTSDSASANITDWVSYNSFETGINGTTISTLPNVDLVGAQTLGDGTLTNIPGDYYQPLLNISSPVNTTYLSPGNILIDIWLNYTDTSYSPTRELWIDDVQQSSVPASGSLYRFPVGAATTKQFNLTLITRDVFNNTAKDTVFFTADTRANALKITILSPVRNTKYNATSIRLDYSWFTPGVTSLDTMNITINGADNATNLPSGSFITGLLASNTITIWVNNSVSSISTTTISFWIDTTPVSPPIGRNIVTPTEGNQSLTAISTTAQFYFKTPVSKLGFYLSANGSAAVQLNLTFAGGINETFDFANTILGLRLEYDAATLGYEAITQFEISSNTPLAWYLDELAFDVLQPRSFVRRFSHLGELIWEYSPPVDLIPWMEVDASVGIVPEIVMVGLAAARDVSFTNDPRGLLALDLASGLPTFHGGLQENIHSGILGKMNNELAPFLVDGVYATELGAIYEFQLIDRLLNQTLEIAIPSSTAWQAHLTTPVKFLDTADFDGDENLDIISITSDGQVASLQNVDGQMIWKTQVNFDPTSLELGNFVGDNVTDIFLSFKGGSLLVIDGATGMIAWRGIMPHKNVESVMNIGDKDSDTFDDLVIGLSIQGNSDTDGFVNVLSGAGDSGDYKSLFEAQLPGPAVQMARAANESANQEYL
ncbi:MAG: FG-GAP repeat domain-containing protein, partial [Candidatus Heimdallarchaeota archaeon]